jgi:uncharacterized membrane protein
MTTDATPGAISAEDRTLPLATYVLMLLSVVTGATAALALVVAVVSRRDAPDEIRSHYDYIIQTFWVAFFSLGLVLALAGLWEYMGYAWLPSLGRLLFMLVSLWVIVRCSIGMLRLGDSLGMAPSRTLGVPPRTELARSTA